jgi:hypothetical protein
MAYFSQKEFAAFIAATVGQAKVSWLALSGRVLNEKESAELEKLLEDFFRTRGHRSFRQHGGGR